MGEFSVSSDICTFLNRKHALCRDIYCKWRHNQQHVGCYQQRSSPETFSSGLQVVAYQLPPKTHKETKRTNVGRHAVKYGPAGRQNTPHVDWKNGGFQLDCRFILTWHAAGRVGGCDDWRKEEKENKRSKHLETSDAERGWFCLANVRHSAFVVGWLSIP